MPQHLGQPYDSWIGRMAKDPTGQRIGKVEDIYTDDDSGLPEWLAVGSGGSATSLCFLPVAGASWDDDDEDLWVPFPREKVRDAPHAGADGRLTREQVARLRAYYGRDAQRRPRRRRMVATEWVSLVAESDEEAARQPTIGLNLDQPPRPPERVANERVPLSASFDDAAETSAGTVVVQIDRPAPPVRRVEPERVSVSAFFDDELTARWKSRLERDQPAPPAKSVQRTPDEPARPARPERPAERERVSLSASFDEDLDVRPDSPLAWNHDDRIDSIRPPRDWHALRR